MAGRRLAPALLELVAITDGAGDTARIERHVAAALAAGVRCFQLREPQWTARAYCEAAARLRPAIAAAGGLLLVNDRLDVAAAGYADGAWLGRRSVPVAHARAVLGADAVLACSAHDAEELAAAAAAGCDFASLSPIWPTSCKPGAAGLGAATAAALTRAAALPVLWLGGIDVARARQVDRGAAGIAVRSAWLATAAPEAVLAGLLAAVRSR